MRLNPDVLSKARRNDRLAALVIRLGGFGVVIAMIGIFVEIIAVTIPLFKAAGVLPVAELQLSQAPVGMWGSEDGRAVAVMYGDGSYETVRAGGVRMASHVSGRLERTRDLTSPVQLRSAAPLGRDQLVVQTTDGRVDLWNYAFMGAATESEVQLAFARTVTQYPSDAMPDKLLVRRTGDSTVWLGWHARDGSIELRAESRTEDWSGNVSVQGYAHRLTAATMSDWLLSHDGRRLYMLDDQGHMLLYLWEDLSRDPVLQDEVQTSAIGVGRLGFALGEVTVLVSDMEGGLSGWFSAPDAAGVRRLQSIHTLPSAQGVRTRIVPTGHDKTIYSLDVAGQLHADHLTTERRLFTVPAQGLRQFSLGGRGDWLHTVDRDHRLQFWQVDNPHPEVTLRALFGRIWYEGYDGPAYVWQSSSGSNDFEPKLSLIPLIFGTAKATLYALLFSVPLALMAAIYVSQLMSERARRYVKPAVEVMASFPSVVIGFLAAIWVAPLLESWLTAFFATLVVLPSLLLLWLAVWYWIGRRPELARRYHGSEMWVVIPIIVMGMAVSVWLAPILENWLFGGDLRQWIFTTVGARYDQRNSIVIAFALGFAVIPLIFTMTDDAMSNVPKSLTAASLALGATRWQTIWKVVLPSASPGIFAAIMIGFGRAVGETMIVLMAAGNTPILDGSILNGMRTLSANIAVEVPEAPHGGTLFRVLFLSAVLLFIVTFIANSAAEIVRQRLRNRYGRF